jgi:hypothetical protein
MRQTRIETKPIENSRRRRIETKRIENARKKREKKRKQLKAPYLSVDEDNSTSEYWSSEI